MVNKQSNLSRQKAGMKGRASGAIAKALTVALLCGAQSVYASGNDGDSQMGKVPEVTVLGTNATLAKITVSGTVIEASTGEPLIGVSVIEKGTTNGTMTDMDGKFTLKVDEKATLQVSYLGFIAQNIVVGNRTVFDIELKEDSKVLDDVVVTALGIKRSQKALSYNVQEVKGDELVAVKDANFMNSLSGKVAGVNINASASGIGGATKVVMRGPSSLEGDNNALYVLDGVPLFNTNGGGVTDGAFSTQPGGEAISDINPDDIETMSVLSGQAAAALYGSEAARGVIMITTKKGQEGKAKVIISNSTTFSKPFVMPEFQNKYGNNPGEYKSWGSIGTPYKYEPKDFFQTGSNVQNSVSLSLGSKSSQSYVSFATTNAEGIVTNNTYDRYNFTARNTTKFLNDKMTLDFGFSYIRQEDQNLLSQGLYFSPLPALYLFPRGENFDEVRMFEEYNEVEKVSEQRWAWGDQGMNMQNPYWIAKRNIRHTKRDRYMGNVSLSYDILDWLNVQGRVRLDNSSNDFTDKRYGSTAKLFTASSEYGFYKNEKSTEKQLYADFLVGINKTFGDYTLDIHGGASISQFHRDGFGFQGGLKSMSNVFNIYNVDFRGGGDNYPIQTGLRKRTNSLFASAEVGWKNMLYLTLTGRNEWSSALVYTDKASFFFPSVGVSGLISEMVALPKFISYAKVRASFSDVGNTIPPGISDPHNQWRPSLGGWETISHYPLGKLKPEKTGTWEVGLTTKFLNNSLSLDVTWYNSQTRNQTLFVGMAPSTGFSGRYLQTGKVENTGLELSVGYKQKWHGFGWDSNLTFSYNKNKIKQLFPDKDPIDGTPLPKDIRKSSVGSLTGILLKGGSMGDMYVTKELKRGQNGEVWVNNGEIELERLNSIDDYKKVGSVLPKSNLGFRNEFTYKGIRLSALITARFGGIVMSPTQAMMDRFGVSKASAEARDNGGIPINGGMLDAKNYYDVVGGPDGLMSNYVYSATNVRLQELTVGYKFPTKWFNNKMGLSASVTGRNLWMIYNKAPFDPEAVASTGTYFQGIDYFMQPSLRNFGFNIKVEF